MRMIDIDIFSNTDLLEIVGNRIERGMNDQQKNTFRHKALNDVKHAIKIVVVHVCVREIHVRIPLFQYLRNGIPVFDHLVNE